MLFAGGRVWGGRRRRRKLGKKRREGGVGRSLTLVKNVEYGMQSNPLINNHIRMSGFPAYKRTKILTIGYSFQANLLRL